MQVLKNTSYLDGRRLLVGLTNLRDLGFHTYLTVMNLCEYYFEPLGNDIIKS